MSRFQILKNLCVFLWKRGRWFYAIVTPLLFAFDIIFQRRWAEELPLPEPESAEPEALVPCYKYTLF